MKSFHPPYRNLPRGISFHTHLAGMLRTIRGRFGHPEKLFLPTVLASSWDDRSWYPLK